MTHIAPPPELLLIKIPLKLLLFYLFSINITIGVKMMGFSFLVHPV